MFVVTQDWYGVQIRCAMLLVEDATQPVMFRDLSIQATRSEEAFDFYGIVGSASFVTLSQTYAFPLQGADFLSAKVGTLMIAAQPIRANGLYAIPGVISKPVHGRCGDGRTGSQQAGNRVALWYPSGVSLHLQFFQPSSEEQAAAALAYTVPIVTTLWMG